ncbi:hypothetical protein RRG08_008705 [Elysia crispata]|uniref:Uncharacterized protein n=1 Tax=Elysia crispata TaxID=231223 RepID=A0AAE0XPT0_9GAST|nr:hypothetical protein RRG08_008705 [Elysia crispata]
MTRESGVRIHSRISHAAEEPEIHHYAGLAPEILIPTSVDDKKKKKKKKNEDSKSSENHRVKNVTASPTADARSRLRVSSFIQLQHRNTTPPTALEILVSRKSNATLRATCHQKRHLLSQPLRKLCLL